MKVVCFLQTRIVPVKNRGKLLQADVDRRFDKAAQFVVNVFDNIHAVFSIFSHLSSDQLALKQYPVF